jgi:hypothetical protein
MVGVSTLLVESEAVAMLCFALASGEDLEGATVAGVDGPAC